VTRALRTLVVRLGLTLLVAFILTGTVFVLYDQLPTDPAQFLDPDPQATSRELAPFAHKLGTDRPLVTQYADYASHAVRGDFGIAWAGMRQKDCDPPGPFAKVCPASPLVGAAVGETIASSLSVTGSLVLGGGVFLLLVAVPLGLLAAARPGSWIDRASVGLVVLGISTHPLVLSVVLQALFGTRWKLAPATGYCTIAEPAAVDEEKIYYFFFDPSKRPCFGLASWASHLVLPWITFALFFSAIYLRMLRASTLETLREPYISTARAKGASERRIVFGHAFPNSVLPILTMLAMDAGMAIGIAIYIESVYGLPGLGQLARGAFTGGAGWDRPMICGLVLAVALIIMLFNTVVNVLYSVLDPRTVGDRPSRRSRVAGGLV
jgi:peptide/nickel transport system permease protein